MKKTKKNKVWFNGRLWDVRDAIYPTGKDPYLLVQVERKDQVHIGSSTHPIELMLIDALNDEYYPDTQKVRNLMWAIHKHKESIERLQNELQGLWLKEATIEK